MLILFQNEFFPFNSLTLEGIRASLNGYGGLIQGLSNFSTSLLLILEVVKSGLKIISSIYIYQGSGMSQKQLLFLDLFGLIDKPDSKSEQKKYS